MKIYNGEGLILGRLACLVAKDALLGEEVRIINAEKAVISGDKFNTFSRERAKRERKGYPLKSQVHSRLPDQFVRRIIRGMLPWKTTRGHEAYKRILCYVGTPAEFAGKEIVSVSPACSAKKLSTLKHITVREICKHLGGKV